jgi:hypothetical protein
MVSKGRNKAVVIQQAHILLKVDEGKTDAEISQMLYAVSKPFGEPGSALPRKGYKLLWKTSPIPRRDLNWMKSRRHALLP